MLFYRMGHGKDVFDRKVHHGYGINGIEHPNRLQTAPDPVLSKATLP
jgi:hypothetical protein